jgi:hypothetical protein
VQAPALECPLCWRSPRLPEVGSGVIEREAKTLWLWPERQISARESYCDASYSASQVIVPFPWLELEQTEALQRDTTCAACERRPVVDPDCKCLAAIEKLRNVMGGK